MNAAPGLPMADLSPVLGSHLSQFDLAELDTFSFTDWVWRAISGDLDLTLGGIISEFTRTFFSELMQNGDLIRQLLVIAILAGFIRCLSDSFKAESAGKVAFYVSYILIIATAVNSFRIATLILSDLIRQTTGMMQAAVPLMVSLTAMSGNIASAAVLNPVLFMGLTIMARFIAYIFIPLVTAAAVLHMLDYMAGGETFTKSVDVIKGFAKSALKFIVFCFLSLLALQKVSAPIANNLALRTARAAAGAVPVVGGALNSAMDTVVNLSAAAKSGVLVALVVVICMAVAVPLIKLLSFMFVYRLIAALIQPICDEKMVKCLDGLADYIGMLFYAGVLVSIMFVFACVIVLMF